MFCFGSLETSPITDSDTAKRTVFQRSYSVVASEYDKQHSSSPARVKAVPRRRVHSGDAGASSTYCHVYDPKLSWVYCPDLKFIIFYTRQYVSQLQVYVYIPLLIH